MPAATTKQELLSVTKKEFDKLSLLLTEVRDDLAVVSDADDTTIKDIVGHRAHWIGLFLGWYHDGLAGKKVCFPAEGYKWNELKRYNANLRKTQVDLDWSTACANLRQAHEQLIDFIENRTNSDLYDAPMVGANNNWTPGRWAEAAGPSHYRSASKYIRRRRKEQGKCRSPDRRRLLPRS